jgi:hypothetical protein
VLCLGTAAVQKYNWTRPNDVKTLFANAMMWCACGKRSVIGYSLDKKKTTEFSVQTARQVVTNSPQNTKEFQTLKKSISKVR